MSTHMKRKHPGEYNVFEVLKDPTYKNTHSKSRPVKPVNFPTVLFPSPDYSGSFLPRINFSDPIEVVERSTKMRMLLNEFSKLSKMERVCLMAAALRLP